MTHDAFTIGYVVCALWASGEDFDEYSVEDIAPDTLATMCEDCATFQRRYSAQLAEAQARGCSAAQLGHDLWLTRNHHGAGYWDRGLGALGEALTEAAHKLGETDLYVGDDGHVRLTLFSEV